MADPVKPQATEGNTPGQAPVPTQGEPKFKFAGKFGSVEEAEKGYLELERAFHEKSRRVSELEQDREFGAQPYQAPTGDQGDILPANRLATRLLQEPEKVFGEFTEQLRKENEGRLGAAIEFLSFEAANPDVAKQRPILNHYLAQLPKDMDAHEKLERAAELTRKYVADLRGGNVPVRDPQPGQFIEDPSGGKTTQKMTPEPEKEVSAAEEMQQYVQGRNLERDNRSHLRFEDKK